MKFYLLLFVYLIPGLSFSAPIKISLNSLDQKRLAKEFSKIDLPYRREEVSQNGPYQILQKYYNFLDVRYALSIGCREEFIFDSTVATNAECFVIFDNELSMPDSLIVHDGFMPELVIAEVKDSELAYILYKTVGNGTSPKVSFNSQEQVLLINPTTGQKFNAFRLRIDCERDTDFKHFNCTVSAVK